LNSKAPANLFFREISKKVDSWSHEIEFYPTVKIFTKNRCPSPKVIVDSQVQKALSGLIEPVFIMVL